MEENLLLITFLVIIALVFDFLNGFHDSSNIVATMISSRAISPKRALIISSICHFLGPFLFGVAVAETIGHEVVAEEMITVPLIFTALFSAIFWNIFTWYFGLPSSSSHALIGGILGSAIMSNFLNLINSGELNSIMHLQRIFEIIKLHGILKVIIFLLISPLFGFIVAYIIIKIVFFLLKGASPKVNWFFKKGQIPTAICLALSHGTNDAQKTMGIITMGLVAGGFLKKFEVPFWVIASAAFAISLGTLFGGWRIIKTIGEKFYKIRPVHGFTSQISSGAVILSASVLGGPVSTTQVVGGSVLGAGSAERFSKVRWGVGKQIFATWIFTLPVTALLGAIFFLIAWSLI